MVPFSTAALLSALCFDRLGPADMDNPRHRAALGLASAIESVLDGSFSDDFCAQLSEALKVDENLPAIKAGLRGP